MQLHTNDFEDSIAADLVDVQEGLKAHKAALEAARAAINQTDELVKRVVEALESLQNAVLEPDEARKRSILVN
jgi:hypothetical protein